MKAKKLSMASEESRDYIDQALKVSRMYYLDDMTQIQIAEEIGCSRSTVSRLLKDSRQLGIIRVEISHVLERIQHLEDELVKVFSLKYARVAQVEPGQSSLSVVPEYAASLLIEHTLPDSLITVSNGRAVAATVRSVPVRDWPGSNVAQMVGALSPSNPMTDSPDICRMLAERLGGTMTALHVPMILSSSQVAGVMRKEPQIATALTLGGGADVALEGVGAMEKDRLSPVFDEYVTPQMVRQMRSWGAVATICGHFVDEEGRQVNTPLSDRTISVDLDRLKRIPLVIGVAWGAEKVRAIKACMIGGYISALVTDQATAEALLGGYRNGGCY